MDIYKPCLTMTYPASQGTIYQLWFHSVTETLANWNNVLLLTAVKSMNWSQSCIPLPTTVLKATSTVLQVYCDMDRVCGCSSTGGWTRVANLKRE